MITAKRTIASKLLDAWRSPTSKLIGFPVAEILFVIIVGIPKWQIWEQIAFIDGSKNLKPHVMRSINAYTSSSWCEFINYCFQKLTICIESSLTPRASWARISFNVYPYRACCVSKIRLLSFHWVQIIN